jgi:hypothetical protein
LLPFFALHIQLIHSLQTSSSIISLLQTSLHVLGIIITIVGLLGPKEPNRPPSQGGKGDEVSAPKSKPGSSKLSEAKPSEKDKPEDAKKPADEKKPEDSSSERAEPQVDKDAITSLIKQSQALYTRVNTEDRTDFWHYGESDQTGYADIDINSRQVNYDDFDMQGFQ